ncbi:bis(5'-nucleosyl)-tetraphosphatase PrpE [Bacillus sp. 2205SS5-2]|uniref:bis(5'-nucleosyl)-tetraphosphatase PrpE n=1 Tax=Bacillus sp. 2205SS5-2 TaxID=3109031 RepID=UPI003007C32E
MKIDVIGDIHGCYNEFEQLTIELGYSWKNGIPLHSERKLAFVGDLTDRGPSSLKVIHTVYQLWKAKAAFYAPGNHCNKLYRYFSGNPIKIIHGLETTTAELASFTTQEQDKYRSMFIELYEQNPLYQVLDNGRLVIAHAGINESDIGRNTKSVKTFVLYGDITGEKNSDGTPVRRDWAKNYEGSAWIVYGHTPVKIPRYVNKTVNIDTGAVFGGKLTAFRYPELKTVSVQSSMPYVPEKFKDYNEKSRE